MKLPTQWPEIEQRLRREPAAAPLPRDAAANILRAVRVADAAAGSRPAHHGHPAWWAGAALAGALALVLTLWPAPLAQPPAPAPAAAGAGLSLVALDRVASSPLRAEWDGLRADVLAAASHVTACLPLPGGG